MNSAARNLAEVPTSAPKTPSVKSRLPQPSQTPRSITQSRVSTKFTPKTPSLNTPTSRFLSNNYSSRSINTSINRSTNQLPKTPISRPPTTPSSSRFSSARTNITTKPSLPRIASTSKPGFNSRLPDTSRNNFYTPIRNKSSIVDQKKLSRTVDCAKSIKRRSIKILNQTAGRLSFLNEMESGCVLMTPKLFQHLINKDKIEEEEEKLNSEDLKVRTIDPNNLLKYLLKDKNKLDNDSKSIKLEIVVNVNSPSQAGNEPVRLNIDTEKIESVLNAQKNSETKILSDKNHECNPIIEQNGPSIQISETKNSSDDSKLAFVPDQACQPLECEKKDIEFKKNEDKMEEKCDLVQETIFEIKPVSEPIHLGQSTDLALANDDQLKQTELELNNETEDENQKEIKNVDFTIPFESVDDEDKVTKIEASKEDENDDVLECKEISLQTDFNDSIKNDEELKSDDKIEDQKIEEIKEVVKGKRGRKPKKVCEDCENSENRLTKEKKSRKPKDATSETSQEKRISGQRILTRAQRAKLATKN